MTIATTTASSSTRGTTSGASRPRSLIDCASDATCSGVRRAQREVELLASLDDPHLVRAASELVELGDLVRGAAWLETYLSPIARIASSFEILTSIVSRLTLPGGALIKASTSSPTTQRHRAGIERPPRTSFTASRRNCSG